MLFANVNLSETTNFNAVDNIIPDVTLQTPSLSSDFNVSNSIEIAVTAIDNMSINTVSTNNYFIQWLFNSWIKSRPI